MKKALIINPGEESLVDLNLAIDLEKVCIKSIVDLTKPKIGEVGGIPAANAKNKMNPPTFKYAVIELQILNYDKNVPPIIKIFDETENKELETVKFKPQIFPCEAPISELNVPVFLSYDKNPWKNPDQEPAERITRIELHMPSLDYVDTVYARLKKGIFVVPVYWHNVAESGRNGEIYVDPLNVINLFWKQPEEYYLGALAPDVNSIWAQAGVQFRLINTSVPFHMASIPTHVVYPPDKSSGSINYIGWKKDLSNKNGVDIYTVYELTGHQGQTVDGIGNKFIQGHILLRASNPQFGNPGLPTLPECVAHEFGHYLGGLCHIDDPSDHMCKISHPKADPSNNLMTSGLAGWKLEQSQIERVRNRIKSSGYNEKK